MLAAPKVIHEENWKHLDVLNTFIYRTVLATLAHFATHHSVIPRRHFYLGFRFLVIHATNFPRADESSLALSLLPVAGISVSVTVSCDEDVGEVDELEELVDKRRTTDGT